MKVCDIPEDNIKYISPDKTFEIGTIGVNAFSIPHDAAEPVGYSFFLGNKNGRQSPKGIKTIIFPKRFIMRLE